MNFSLGVTERRLQSELMDQPDLDVQRHHQALRALGRINYWSRSAQILWRPLRELQRETRGPLRVLDLACGGGDVICRLARKAQRAGLDIAFVGCDKSFTAVEYAKRNARRSGVQVEFFVANVLTAELPRNFDVVSTSLFLHHLNEPQAESLLKRMAATASELVLVNDLLRNYSGLLLARVGTRLLSMSPVVHLDGPRSVEGAYTREEVVRLAESAGLHGASIMKCWPQRFMLSWRKR